MDEPVLQLCDACHGIIRRRTDDHHVRLARAAQTSLVEQDATAASRGAATAPPSRTRARVVEPIGRARCS